MNIKELTIKQLLTTDASYKAIVAEIRTSFPTSQSTEKCVAFYAHQLRKIDPKCLAHRDAKRGKTNTTAQLLNKYKS